MALLREIDATHSPHVTAPESLAALLQGDRNRAPVASIAEKSGPDLIRRYDFGAMQDVALTGD